MSRNAGGGRIMANKRIIHNFFDAVRIANNAHRSNCR